MRHVPRLLAAPFARISAWLSPLILAACLPSVAEGGRFPDAHEEAPSGWTGPKFVLSQDYPADPPPAEDYPWKKIDFRTDPYRYLKSVRDYVYEGNIDVDWRVGENRRRKWYHAPWMHSGESGREFIRGLTRERESRPGELHDDQVSMYQTWAVGFYNPPGGYIVGRVWRDKDNPDPSAARFPEGTVGAKLLFTQAGPDEVPYLKGAVTWQANIHAKTLPLISQQPPGVPRERKVQGVRLLQMDVAIRDRRADATTGWVFGTFVYNAKAAGETPWERMEPVGLMWGNDPGVTPPMVRDGYKLKETWINPKIGTKQHLGWAGRLNGIVDNPASSCLSCHAVAQHPQSNNLIPSGSEAEQAWRWFRNVRAGEPFDIDNPKVVSLDYSLQLGMGIQHLEAEKSELLAAGGQAIPKGNVVPSSKAGLATPAGQKVYPVTRQEIDPSITTDELLQIQKKRDAR